MSLSTMPPATPFIGFGRTCFFARLTPSTTTWSASTRRTTVPRLPLSLPVITTTSSPLRIFSITRPLQNFRSQGHDLHEALGTQFAGDRAKDARADRLELVIEKDCGIAIKAHQRAIRTTNTLGSTNHHGIIDITLLHATARRSVLDADLDDIANTSITALGATQHFDTHYRTRTGVIGDVQNRLHLNHLN